MLTGEIRYQIDAVWNAFWSDGISNPLEVIEQITYLLFIKRLDELHTLQEKKSVTLKRPMERRVFPEGKDARGRSYDDLRWSRFKHFALAEVFTVEKLKMAQRASLAEMGALFASVQHRAFRGDL